MLGVSRRPCSQTSKRTTPGTSTRTSSETRRGTMTDALEHALTYPFAYAPKYTLHYTPEARTRYTLRATMRGTLRVAFGARRTSSRLLVCRSGRWKGKEAARLMAESGRRLATEGASACAYVLAWSSRLPAWLRRSRCPAPEWPVCRPTRSLAAGRRRAVPRTRSD